MMKLQVTIPEILVTLETTGGTLPAGTMIQLSVPLKGLATQPVPEPIPVPAVPVIPAPDAPDPTPSPNPVKRMPALDRTYDQVEFRAAAKRADLLGNAMTLGLSDADWTMILNVRFVNFDTEQRVIGSSTYEGPGTSLQIGTLKDGSLWLDTIGGMSSQEKLELNRWYEVAVSHHTNGLEKIYLDKRLIHQGHIPTFHSTADIYVGRWLNDYHDFDLSRVRIYPLLSDEEVGEI